MSVIYSNKFHSYSIYNNDCYKYLVPDKYLSDIEILYLDNKLEFNDYKLIYVHLNKNLSKTCVILLLNTDTIINIKIPKLKIYYKNEDIYCYPLFIEWKKPNKDVIVREMNDFEYIKKKNYKVGYKNKYGWKICFIGRKKIVFDHKQVIDRVSLTF